MADIEILLDKYFQNRIDPCANYPIPICLYDLQEALKELKSTGIKDNKDDIELLEQVISILKNNHVSMTQIIYHVK